MKSISEKISDSIKKGYIQPDIVDNNVEDQIEAYINTKTKEDKKQELKKLVELINVNIHDLLVEWFAPEVEKWVIEEFAPEVQNWTSEELIPTAKEWMQEQFIPSFKYKFMKKFIKYKDCTESFTKFAKTH